MGINWQCASVCLYIVRLSNCQSVNGRRKKAKGKKKEGSTPSIEVALHIVQSGFQRTQICCHCILLLNDSCE